MRVTTLKASTAGLSQLLDYYAGLAEDRELSGSGRGPVDYYLDPDEPPGRWAGTGRHVLGLGGTVPGGQLRALLEGEQPGTSRQLGRRFGDSSARGFDATFSAPKSVSVLWALTPDPWVRAEVLAAHDTAVDAALEWFEHHGAVTRRGTDGVHQVDTRGITAAVFRQHTSRTVDPQLHTHAVISAKVQDPTGRWLSLDARFLKYQQRTIGWIYDAALRTELAQRLGATWSVRDCGVWDLDCIPDHEHPDRGTAHLRADYVAEHVELGWAVTGYGNQGDTVDIGIAILEPTSSRNHTYVALTRGRHANHAILPTPPAPLTPPNNSPNSSPDQHRPSPPWRCVDDLRSEQVSDMAPPRDHGWRWRREVPNRVSMLPTGWRLGLRARRSGIGSTIWSAAEPARTGEPPSACSRQATAPLAAESASAQFPGLPAARDRDAGRSFARAQLAERCCLVAGSVANEAAAARVGDGEQPTFVSLT